MRRSVRIVATPPADLHPGEYWGRLVVAVRRHGRGEASVECVATQLDVEVRSILGLFSRKEPLTTGVTVADVAAVREGDSLVVRPTLVRRGTAAFVGTVHAEVRDAYLDKLRPGAS